jgi:hypothetical protein
MLDPQISYIKEQIAELKEYLNTDICKSCGDVAIKLEGYIKELQELLDNRPS